MNFEWKGLTACHLKAFLEMKLHISERTEGLCAHPMCTGVTTALTFSIVFWWGDILIFGGFIRTQKTGTIFPLGYN